MRVSCTFECSRLPTSYNMMFVSLIKKSIETASEDYFKRLYFFGEQANKKSKNFTFSVFLKDFTRESDEFSIQGEVKLFVSSPDPEWMIHFYNGLSHLDTFTYQGFHLKKKRVHMLKEKEVSGSVVICQTMSPIHICNKQKQPLSPDKEEFNQEFQYISNLIIKNYLGKELRSPIKFVPIQLKKAVVKEAIRGFTQNTQLEHMYLEGFKGMFALEGHPEDLRTLYQLGVGFRRNSGWGMFEVIHS